MLLSAILSYMYVYLPEQTIKPPRLVNTIINYKQLSVVNVHSNIFSVIHGGLTAGLIIQVLIHQIVFILPCFYCIQRKTVPSSLFEVITQS